MTHMPGSNSTTYNTVFITGSACFVFAALTCAGGEMDHCHQRRTTEKRTNVTLPAKDKQRPGPATPWVFALGSALLNQLNLQHTKHSTRVNCYRSEILYIFESLHFYHLYTFHWLKMGHFTLRIYIKKSDPKFSIDLFLVYPVKKQEGKSLSFLAAR